LVVNTLCKVKYVKTLCPTHVTFKSLNPIKIWYSRLTGWLYCVSTLTHWLDSLWGALPNLSCL
jgi:hypothetical protein